MNSMRTNWRRVVILVALACLYVSAPAAASMSATGHATYLRDAGAGAYGRRGSSASRFSAKIISSLSQPGC